MCFINERTFSVLCPEHYFEHLLWEVELKKGQQRIDPVSQRTYASCQDFWTYVVSHALEVLNETIMF